MTPVSRGARRRSWLVLTLTLALLAGIAPPAAAQWTATWTAKGSAPSPPTGPGPRGWVDMTFDNVSNRVVLLGGSGEWYYDDVLAYDTGANSWMTLAPYKLCWETVGHTPPTGRDEHAVEYDVYNRLYWTFGGSGYACKGSARTAGGGSNTTTIVDGTLPSTVVDFYKHWTVDIVANGSKAYVSAYDPATRTLSLSTPLAGLASGVQYYLYPQRGGGTWAYAPATGTWTSLTGPYWGYTGPAPSSRLSPAMAYSPADRAMVMFGGDAGASRNDTWALDVETKSWVQMITQGAAGSPPSLRQITNSMVYNQAHDVFILFGGRRDSGSASNETWAYRLSSNTWTRLLPPVSPPAREQHTLAYDSDNHVVVLFGGSGFADTWVFDYAANTWTQVTPATSPPGRRIAAMVYDPVNRVTVLYGGLTGTTSLRDVWTLRLVAAGSNPAPTLDALSPSSATQGDPGFTLTLTGSGFVGSSVAQWNGAARPTTHMSATTLRADIPASDLAAAGTATVTVSTPAPGGGVSGARTFTINPAPLPTVTIAATTATATEAGASPGAFTVSRTGSTSAALTVTYAVGGSATPASDYVALSGTLTIPAGSASAPIVVTPVDDTLVEADETVIVTLSAGAAYVVGSPGSATVTIVSDDALPTVTIAATTATATEAGASPGAFTVSRTGSTSAALTATYAVGGGATAGSDYVTLSGTLTIPAGSASAPIVVTPIDDALVEADETVIVTLSAGAAYVVGAPSAATVTIVSDDVTGGPTTVIIDNRQPGTSFVGSWCVSSASGFYGTDSLQSCGARGIDIYRWTPTLAAGAYDVYVWWTSQGNRSTTVPISVTHGAGTTTLTFNQKTGGGQWVIHGRYTFAAGTAGYVEVSDVNGRAAADAVRFVPGP